MKYKYKLRHTQRKTMSISITVENEITVRAPWSAHEKDVEEFLESKKGWIEKVVNENARKFFNNEDVVNYEAVLVDGAQLPVVIGDKNEIADDCVYLKDFKYIESVYEKKFGERLYNQVCEMAKITKTFPKSVKIKAYRGRWGCCDPQNNLVFNFLLFMLPPRLQRYVIVHELCHTVCHNHSAGFWKLVSDFLPDYKADKKLLKSYDFLTVLY